MKIYTRVGDEGNTGLLGGATVLKSHRRIASFGTVDELNAQLGLCRATQLPLDIEKIVGRLQHEMFALGAELASPDSAPGISVLDEQDVARLEADIDRHEAELAPLANFILPGGSPQAAALHAARCACRRAEREVVSLAQEAALRPVLLKYLNRVGDLLFVLARSANAAAGVSDVLWQKPAR